MTVGQFNDSFKPIMDGVGLCAENYARWIHEKYGTAHVVVPAVPNYEDDDPFNVVRYPSVPVPRMPPYRLGLPRLSRRLHRFLAQTDFDIVHSHSPFGAGRLARRTARRHGIPHVATFHTKYREDALRYVSSERLVDVFIRRLVSFYETCDEVWTPSEATKETLRQYGFSGPVMVAPNGSDLERPSEEDRRRYRDRGGELADVSADAFVFLFVGQHRWEKNVDLILRGVAALQHREEQPAPFALVFVGEGYARGEMQRQAEGLGIAERTRFLGKVVERDQMKALYARSDLFLFPSIYDNAPLVMREAAAFGVPTVVAQGSSAAEAITLGKNGFGTPNNAEGFADTLADLMRNPDRIRAVGRDAAETVYRGWEEIVDWVVEQYRRIIRSS